MESVMSDPREPKPQDPNKPVDPNRPGDGQPQK